MFKVKNYVLYNYNVCKINEIVKINGNDYYVLVPVTDESLTIKAPVTQEGINIRRLLTKKEIKQLIDKMNDIKIIDIPDHKLEQEYKRLLNTGNREDLVSIIKTTYLRNEKRKETGKKVGEKDSIYFNLAEKSLYSEIAIVLKTDINKAKDYVVKRLEKGK